MFTLAWPTAAVFVLLGDFSLLVDACSCVVSTKTGVFLKDPRPLLGDPNKVIATLELFLDLQQPIAKKEVIVDLNTGDVEENTNGKILPPPISLTDPSGGYNLTVQTGDADDMKPTATLTPTNGTSAEAIVRLDLRPDGSKINITDKPEWWPQVLQEDTFHFYSPTLDLFFVVYDPEKVTISTFKRASSDSSALIPMDTFYARGLHHAYPLQEYIGYGTTRQVLEEMVYDDVHVLELGGGRGDCIQGQFAYYKQTSVSLIAKNFFCSAQWHNLTNSMQWSPGDDQENDTFFKVHITWHYEKDDTPCDDDPCRTTIVDESQIEEFLVSDPQKVLRKVTLSPKKLEALFEEYLPLDASAARQTWYKFSAAANVVLLGAVLWL